MLELNNQFTNIKSKVGHEVVKRFFDGTLKEDIDKIPYILIPKNGTPSRCCIYKERAMIRYRIMALLGVNIERDDDELKPLADYLQEVLDEDKPLENTLTTISTGCSGCPKDRYIVSSACRGCYARPCIANCPKNAIEFINGQAHIREDVCIRCGKCHEVCPFHSIVHVPVPCEDACPVGAIKKNEEGFVEIDYSKCISCGKCSRSCPFGAIVERSGLFPVLKMLQRGDNVTAMFAPSIDGQFPGTLGQIKSALLKAGFTNVIEVSEGAHLTAAHEAEEVIEKKAAGEWMTTSCCPSYMEMVEKHLPFLKERTSSALSPMGYTVDLIKERWPESKIVFIGPCLCKRKEAMKKYSDTIDAVITFSELSYIFMGKNLDVNQMEDLDMGDIELYKDCRDFAVSEGVSGCVVNRLKEGESIRALPINGVDKKMFRVMKTWERRKPDADIVEVMMCEGGCINGPGTIVKPAVALKLRGGHARTPVRAVKGLAK